MTIIRPLHLLVAALLASPVAACVGGSAGLSLDGREFLSSSVTEGGVDRPLVAGTQIRLGFIDGRLTAAAGCNTMGGSYRIDGGSIVVDAMAMTEMGCDPARHAQDDWLGSFLGGRPAVRLAGSDLALESNGTIVRLVDREVADPDLPLVGPTWTVDSTFAGDAVSNVPADVVATFRFTGDGRVAIATGCNEGGARVEGEAGMLRFIEIILTERACQGPAGEMERAVLAVLQADAVSYAIEADRLTLMAGSSGLGLRGT